MHCSCHSSVLRAKPWLSATTNGAFHTGDNNLSVSVSVSLFFVTMQNKKKSINLFPFHFSCKNVPKPRSEHNKKKIPWTNKFMSNVFIFFFSVQFAARVIRWYPKWNPNQNYGYFDTDHIEKHWTSKFHWLIVTNRPAILIKLSYELQANWTMHGKV